LTGEEKALVVDPERDPVAHAEYLENIRKSYAKYGPIRPAIVSRFGILAGAGRKEAVPEWPEVDRKKTDERVKTKFDAYAFAAMDNIHEQKSASWWTILVTKAAETVEEEGTPTEEVCRVMIERFPLSEATTRRYIPDKFKQQVRVEAGKKSAEARREKKEAEVPYKVSHPPPASEVMMADVHDQLQKTPAPILSPGEKQWVPPLEETAEKPVDQPKAKVMTRVVIRLHIVTKNGKKPIFDKIVATIAVMGQVTKADIDNKALHNAGLFLEVLET